MASVISNAWRGLFQLNLIFMCNIVRVLVTKIRAVNSPDNSQTRFVY